MRVVKAPDHSKWRKRVKCKRCKARLEAVFDDIGRRAAESAMHGHMIVERAP